MYNGFTSLVARGLVEMRFGALGRRTLARYRHEGAPHGVQGGAILQLLVLLALIGSFWRFNLTIGGKACLDNLCLIVIVGQ